MSSSRLALLGLIALLPAAAVACARPPHAGPRAGPPAPAALASTSASAPAAAAHGRAKLVREATLAEPLATSSLGRRFLAAAGALPEIAPRTLYRNKTPRPSYDDDTRYFTSAQAELLPPAEGAKLQSFTVDEDMYYEPFFGTALAYLRPLDLVDTLSPLPAGAKIFDFGYGQITQLRMLASLGFDVTGVDTQPLYLAMYGFPGDLGAIAAGERKGQLRILDGHFPADPAILASVGGGYDLVISKNTLKRGYVRPEQPLEPGHGVALGVSDEVALKSFFQALKPGGVLLVYNVCPKYTPPGPAYKPWSDGRSPWSQAAWEAAGFRVVAFDRDDAEAVKAMGRALRWNDPADEDPWDFENDLSVLYTLVTRSKG